MKVLIISSSKLAKVLPFFPKFIFNFIVISPKEIKELSSKKELSKFTKYQIFVMEQMSLSSEDFFYSFGGADIFYIPKCIKVVECYDNNKFRRVDVNVVSWFSLFLYLIRAKFNG